MTSVTQALSRTLTEIGGGGDTQANTVRANSVHPNTAKGPLRNPVYDALMARFRSFLGERAPQKDEAGRNIAWSQGGFSISVNDPERLTALHLWEDETKKQIGFMALVPGRTSATKDWAVVRNVGLNLLDQSLPRQKPEDHIKLSAL